MTTPIEPPPARTARERARAEINAEILAAAQRQLATVGPSGLSLRAVARELGLASSAVYRYVASRDELLTRLIIAAYDSLGMAAEAAAAGEGSPIERWLATAAAIRRWAIDHPHDYALVFGTPVPGYAAPEDTTSSGTRASLALVGIVVDAWDAGALEPRSVEVEPAVTDDLTALAALTGFAGPPTVLLDVLTAWTQLYGLITFELFGQTRNLIIDHEAFFAAATERMARQIGFVSPG